MTRVRLTRGSLSLLLRRYASLAPEEVPDTECLKDTVARFVPYYESVCLPACLPGPRSHNLSIF